MGMLGVHPCCPPLRTAGPSLLPMSTTTERQSKGSTVTDSGPCRPFPGVKVKSVASSPTLWVSLTTLLQGLSPSQQMAQR